mmetsp:Transcript_113799/g.361675  ORF Transcript_113799/g.361675 Transcript_113799/m.361675 type:complete len:271 (+) Transcript_113799:1837-2649(+)
MARPLQRLKHRLGIGAGEQAHEGLEVEEAVRLAGKSQQELLDVCDVGGDILTANRGRPSEALAASNCRRARGLRQGGLRRAEGQPPQLQPREARHTANARWRGLGVAVCVRLRKQVSEDQLRIEHLVLRRVLLDVVQCGYARQSPTCKSQPRGVVHDVNLAGGCRSLPSQRRLRDRTLESQPDVVLCDAPIARALQRPCLGLRNGLRMLAGLHQQPSLHLHDIRGQLDDFLALLEQLQGLGDLPLHPEGVQVEQQQRDPTSVELHLLALT